MHILKSALPIQSVVAAVPGRSLQTNRRLGSAPFLYAHGINNKNPLQCWDTRAGERLAPAGGAQTPVSMENVETTPSERNCQHRGNQSSNLEQLLAAIGRLRYQVEQLQDQLDGSEPRLLDVDQVANRLNLSERSVRSLISDGTIPSTKIRRRRLVPREALESFIKRQLEDSGRG